VVVESILSSTTNFRNTLAKVLFQHFEVTFHTSCALFSFRSSSFCGGEVVLLEPGRRWAHNPSSSKASGISYQGTMKTSVKMLKTSEGL